MPMENDHSTACAVPETIAVCMQASEPLHDGTRITLSTIGPVVSTAAGALIAPIIANDDGIDDSASKKANANTTYLLIIFGHTQLSQVIMHCYQIRHETSVWKTHQAKIRAS